MGRILEFRQLPDEREALRRRLQQVQAQLARLDQEEPEDMESPAYDDWAERHEELEDLADDLMDALEP